MTARQHESLDQIDDPESLYRRASGELQLHQEVTEKLSAIRNRACAAMYARGGTYRDLAERTGLSTPRIGQLITAAGPEVLEVFKAWHSIELVLAKLTPDTDRSLAILRAQGLDPEILNQLNTLREANSRYLHAREAPENADANRFADTAILINAQLTVWMHHRREVMAILPGSALGHRAWPAQAGPEMVTLCGLTGTPTAIDPDRTTAYCPDCLSLSSTPEP